jgi:preprotein translocase subunit SecE
MAFKNPLLALVAFLKESRAEARKVDWPTRQQTIRNTIVVVLFAVAVAVFLSAFDFLFTTLLERFIL